MRETVLGAGKCARWGAGELGLGAGLLQEGMLTSIPSLSLFFLQACGFPRPSGVNQYALREAHDEMRYQVNKLMVT